MVVVCCVFASLATGAIPRSGLPDFSMFVLDVWWRNRDAVAVAFVVFLGGELGA